MTDFNAKPDGAAENLIGGLFSRLEGECNPRAARLRLERRLDKPRRRRIGTAVKILAFVTGLLLLGGWASQAPVAGWDDGQLITIEAPDGFTPASYPYWAALFANHAQALEEHGGQSLVLDYRLGRNDDYYLQLGIIGVNYSEANAWLRDVMAETPALSNRPYTITQPLVPYNVSVREMIAFALLGDSSAEERKVVSAWRAAGERPQHIFLIAKTSDYARRVSMLEY
jgi:hypothetical protein